MKKRLLPLILIVSLICACDGSEQATNTPHPTRFARATHMLQTAVPPIETPAPMATDVLPILRGMGRDVISFFRKAALVQEFGMEYGGRKVIEPPPGSKLPYYPSRDAALKYLLE